METVTLDAIEWCDLGCSLTCACGRRVLLIDNNVARCRCGTDYYVELPKCAVVGGTLGQETPSAPRFKHPHKK
jgi:hypothetical protein